MIFLKSLLPALFVFQTLPAFASTPEICAGALIAHLSESKDQRMSLDDLELALIGRTHATVVVSIPVAQMKGSLFNIAHFNIAPGLTARPEFSAHHEGTLNYVVEGDHAAWLNAYTQLESLGDAKFQIVDVGVSATPASIAYPRDHVEVTSDMTVGEVQIKITDPTDPYVLLHYPSAKNYLVYPFGKLPNLSSLAWKKIGVVAESDSGSSMADRLPMLEALLKSRDTDSFSIEWRTHELITNPAFFKLNQFIRNRDQNFKLPTSAPALALRELIGIHPSPPTAPVVESSPVTNSLEPVAPEPVELAPIAAKIVESAPIAAAPAPAPIAAPSPNRAPKLVATAFAEESDYREFVAILKTAADQTPNELRPRNYLRDGLLGLALPMVKPAERSAMRDRILNQIGFEDFDSRANFPYVRVKVRARVIEAARLLGSLLDVDFSTPLITSGEAKELFGFINGKTPAPAVTESSEKAASPVVEPPAPPLEKVASPPPDIGLHFVDDLDYKSFVDLLRQNARYWPASLPGNFLRDSMLGFLLKIAPAADMPQLRETLNTEIAFDATDIRAAALNQRSETRLRVAKAARLLAEQVGLTWEGNEISRAQAEALLAKLLPLAPETHDYRFENPSSLDALLKMLADVSNVSFGRNSLETSLTTVIDRIVHPNRRREFVAFVLGRLNFEHSDAEYILADKRRVQLMHLLFGLANEFGIEWSKPVVTSGQVDEFLVKVRQLMLKPPAFDLLPPAPVALRFAEDADYTQFVDFLVECSAYWQFAPMPHIPFNDAVLGLLAQITPPEDQERVRKALLNDVHFRLTDNRQSVLSSENREAKPRVMRAVRLLAQELQLDWNTPAVTHPQAAVLFARLRRLVPLDEDLGFADPASKQKVLTMLSETSGVPVTNGFVTTALTIIADRMAPEKVREAIRNELSASPPKNHAVMRVLYRLAEIVGVNWSRPRVSRAQANEFVEKLRERLTAPPAAGPPPIQDASELPPIDQTFDALSMALGANQDSTGVDDLYALRLLHETFPGEASDVLEARLNLLRSNSGSPRELMLGTWKTFAATRLGSEFATMPLTPASLSRVREQFLVETPKPAAPPAPLSGSEVEAANLFVDFLGKQIMFGTITDERGLRQAFTDVIHPVLRRLRNLRTKSDIEKAIDNKSFLGFRYRTPVVLSGEPLRQVKSAISLLRLAMDLPEVSGTPLISVVDDTVRVYSERFPRAVKAK